MVYILYVAMHIETVPNRKSRPCILLRQSYRESGKVKKRTIANLTDWSPELVEDLRLLLRGGKVVERAEDTFDIMRSRPHGHVRAVLGTLYRIGLDRTIGGAGSQEHALTLAMVAARVIDPQSKLATARGLNDETLFSTLGEELGLAYTDENELYAAMDWLVERQDRIEVHLAKQHLQEGTLVLYDVMSTYFEGRTCPLAKLGHNRDKKKGKLQIVIGLLCTSDGCPVAVEVFPGNTGDPSTLQSQITRIRGRFGLDRVVFVGDRGLLTEARIRKDIEPVEGLDWITALRAGQIRKLVDSGSLQFSLFDERNLAEITDPAFPGERLIVCRNPLLAAERSRKRQELLVATQKELDKIVLATQREKRALKGKARIALKVGKAINKFKMAKHFHLSIGENGFSYQLKEDNIAKEAALDGIYVIWTSLPPDKLDAEGAVKAYKGLSVVERAFRCFKAVDLKVRPIHHRLEHRVRAHVFLCMLAYYLEWHMRRALSPILFDDDDPLAAEAQRDSVVEPAQRSPSAQQKALSKRTKENLPVHSFRTLLKDLATISKNLVKPRLKSAPSFEKTTLPAVLQRKAFKLLGVKI